MPTANPEALLAMALEYARRGWPVFPLHTPTDAGCSCNRDCGRDAGKHPRTTNGLKDASTDELAIRRWWKMWPQANIGLCVPDGFVVVDLDDPEAAQELKGRGCEMPHTAVQITGRGWHYVYRTPSHIGPKGHIFGSESHVDLRGPGGYIVAEPSVHLSGATYRWQIGLDEIAPAPIWLRQFEGGSQRQSEYAPVDFSKVLQGLPEGQRKIEIYRAASKARGAGIPIEWTIELAQQTAAKCRPPLEPAQAERKVREAYGKYPENVQPGANPPNVTLLGSDSVMVEFESATFVFNDMTKMTGPLEADIEVTPTLPGAKNFTYPQHLNLESVSSRGAVRLELDHTFGKEYGWTALMVEAIDAAKQAYLSIPRATRASEITFSTDLEYLIDEVILNEGVTIPFGAGASTKTFQVMHQAICIAAGIPWLGRATRKASVCFIDYETGRKTWARRLHRLAAGLDLDVADLEIYYWWADGLPFHDMVDALKRYRDEHAIGCFILDHIAVACGEDATEQRAASKFFRAAARLDTPMIALAHVTGEAEKKIEHSYRPFGSIFWSNQARQTWFVNRQQEELSPVAKVGFLRRKVNEGAPPRNFATTVTFEDPNGPITITDSDIMATPSLMKGDRDTSWIIKLLDEPMTYKELMAASAMGKTSVENAIRDAIRQNKVEKLVGTGTGHPDNPAKWVRIDTLRAVEPPAEEGPPAGIDVGNLPF